MILIMPFISLCASLPELQRAQEMSVRGNFKEEIKRWKLVREETFPKMQGNGQILQRVAETEKKRKEKREQGRGKGEGGWVGGVN